MRYRITSSKGNVPVPFGRCATRLAFGLARRFVLVQRNTLSSATFTGTSQFTTIPTNAAIPLEAVFGSPLIRDR